MLPFVPESRVWLEKRRAGTLKRPSLAELFSPRLRRTTLVTAALSACAYGAAGQRTKTNARTRKGPKKGSVAMKKPVRGKKG